MINAVGSAGSGREWTSRPAAFAGMGNQALLNAFLEEFRRQQAKSCEQDVDKVKRSGMPEERTQEKDREAGDPFIF